MSIYDAPSPAGLAPSAMPPPNLKRARESNVANAPTPTADGRGATNPPRAKRRKPDDEYDRSTGRGGGAGASGSVKGKDEDGEEKDFVVKIDFNELPDDTLFRYLEQHDLLPRWTESPWSELDVTPPEALYLAPPPTAAPDPPPTVTGSVPPEQPPTATATAAATGEDGTPMNVDEEATPGEEQEGAGQRTTRSKTLPFRKQPTPPPVAPKPVNRGVITLSDVGYARGVLAEKANSHWVKGLGGGQNRESETIVNFLYKMKVGPGKLLRVYNPAPGS